MAKRTPLPIVALGASAGGLEPLRSFFHSVPAGSGMAYVVVTHMAPERDSMLVDILARSTVLTVQVASDSEKIVPERVYVIPPGSFMTVEAGRLKLQKPAEHLHPKNTIDVFFAALAEDAADQAVGIVLSGAGSDGALGIKAIKEKGGLTLAQGLDHTPLLHSSMPDSAINTGLVDYILPPDAMVEQITAYFEAAGSAAAAIAAADGKRSAGESREAICTLLRDQVGHDFIGYKPTTFMRRVQRRMQVFRITSIADYVEKLRREPAEIAALFRDLLIGVTYFFRDPDAFDLLRREVVPQLFEGRGPADTVRVWAPGCATGEEVYSLAMLLHEHAQALARPPRISVFGTDLDDAALSIARQGHYPATILKDVSEERLKRYFTGDGVNYSVKKELRDLCIFSAHNIVQDPPFSRIDLVTCRNLLIYMGSDLQKRVVPVFHYALRSGGFLFLGLAENVSQHSELFTPLDKKCRVFRRVDHAAPAQPLPMFLTAHHGRLQLPGDRGATRDGVTLRNSIDRFVMEYLAPAHVVVDRSGNLVHASTRTGNYLELAPGQPSRYVLAMARKGLRIDLRSALDEAMGEMHTAVRDPVELEVGGKVRHIRLTVQPVPSQSRDPLFLVVFEDIGPLGSAKPAAQASLGEQDALDQQLEHELRETRDRLQSTIEEYETSLEETKSTNEELVSLNEELQSTNEELETSKEEIQSVNEELQTVNLELQSKIGELDTANADLQNLFASTQIAIVFLETGLRIRTFTPAVTEIFNLIGSDRGRPLTDIASHFPMPHLKPDIQSVWDSGAPVERRVDDGRDRHYLMRILPYRSVGGDIDGVLLTFVNIGQMVKAESHLRTMVHELNHRVRNMLTVVTAMARQTARRTKDPEAFIESFSGRLNAMAKAYDIVSEEQWNDVQLMALIQSQIRPHVTAEAQPVSIAGPAVSIRPKAAIALGMVVHEMCTNALKYGALSAPKGRVRIAWSIERSKTGQDLVLRWQESGGPPVKSPENNGFGTALIEREVQYELNGDSSLKFERGGVQAAFRMPIDPDHIVVGAPDGGGANEP